MQRPAQRYVSNKIIVFYEVYKKYKIFLYFLLSQARGGRTHCIKFLREHSETCDCGPCFSSETKFQLFCAAVVYARFVYLNEDEFSAEAMRSVFKQLITFWEDNRNDKRKFPRTDMFYVMSARMLLYSGHYFWKFENDRVTAVTQLKRGLKGLDKVKYGACLTKQDLELQIRNMEETIKEERAPREKKFLRFKSRFDDEPMMISEASVPYSNFEIASCKVRPKYKKVYTEEVPARTPSRRVKPTEIAAGLIAAVERPKLGARPKNLIPTIHIDLDSDSDNESTKVNHKKEKN